MNARYDYQQQQEQDRRREEEDRAWLKKWRDTWAAWAKKTNDGLTTTNENKGDRQCRKLVK